MSILLLLAILAVLGGIAMVASGRGAAMADPDPDRAPFGVLPPEQQIVGSDVERLRFSLAFRGYRMDEVDDVLDRLTGELAERDARIAELEGAAQPEDGADVESTPQAKDTADLEPTSRPVGTPAPPTDEPARG